MRRVNEGIFLGNAPRDPELCTTTSGKPVANLRLATNRSRGDRETAQYHTGICWDTLTEWTSQYGKKGDPPCVEGWLAYRTFQDEEGKERGVAEIVASDVLFLSRTASAQDAAPTSVDETVDVADVDLA